MGIVQFSSDASTLSPLIQISSDENREALIETLPETASGGTEIGKGIKRGIEVRTAQLVEVKERHLTKQGSTFYKYWAFVITGFRTKWLRSWRVLDRHDRW